MNRLSFICTFSLHSLLSFFQLAPKSNTEALTSFIPQDTILSVVVDDFQELNADLASGPWGPCQTFQFGRK